MPSARTLIVTVAMLLAVGAVEAGDPTTPSQRTILTFSGPVSLPGLTLNAGTYVFELADPNGNDDAVVVMNEDRNHVYYLGMTKPVRRPANLRRDQAVTFGVAERGTPVPIAAWYPLSDLWGHQFIYPPR
jgi:hypothetical protein